jgi:DNA-binding transcriptional LysR family regulator
VPIVERVLTWAHAILDNWTSLPQDIAALRNTSGSLAGRLSVGVIPSALPIAGLITKAIRDQHPRIQLQRQSFRRVCE